jgi:uncharacterized protein YbjT (DUF2867 family)
MILVVGGSGTLGTLLVERLRSRDLDVRVLTRDRGRAAHLEVLGADVVEGDAREPATLVPALAGVETVVSAMHGLVGPGGVSPASVDRDGNRNLVDAATDEGAAVVMVSGVGVSRDSPMELFRMKFAAEQHLQTKATPWTIVRATTFLETWIGLMQQTSARSGRPLVFGQGNNPINFVSAIDVAALVELAVTDSSLRGQIVEIGGPLDVTFNELAVAVQAAAGRTTTARHVPRPVLRAMGATLGLVRPELARQARAALVLDREPFTFDDRSIRQRYPDLPMTTTAQVLAGRVNGRSR